MPTSPDDHAIPDILAFWFAEERRPRWYDSTADFDALCRTRYGALVDKAVRGELDAFQGSPEGALALCLLLDQMPRNIFRGTPEAFQGDRAAVRVAAAAIEHGFDRELAPDQRRFLYMPFMHSEVLAEQERSVRLFGDLNDDSVAYAEDHAAVIRRFGRFPHRNAILGRASTAEELAYLAETPDDYGQALAKG